MILAAAPVPVPPISIDALSPSFLATIYIELGFELGKTIFVGLNHIRLVCPHNVKLPTALFPHSVIVPPFR